MRPTGLKTVAKAAWLRYLGAGGMGVGALVATPTKKKAIPDCAPRGRISVHLSEYVAKDVSDRKQYLRAADAERAEGEELGGNDVGNHQNHHEQANERV